MNAERLHAIAIILNQEMTETDSDRKLREVVNSLQNVINQPQQSQHQQNLANNLKSLYSALIDKPSDRFSPAWRQLLSEIGGEKLFGGALKSEIENILSRNQITPAVALEELMELQKEVQSFKAALEQLLSSFRQFAIGDEKLTSGHCEIGILIPRKAVDNQLIHFAEELNELAFILNTLSEVATGKKDLLEIKTISSTDLTVYLKAVAPYAACLAVAVERIVSLYKQLLEIRLHRTALLKQGVPEERTAPIDEYANNLMKMGTDKIADEIVEKFYKKKESGRRNELITATKISLNRIANRIDRGYNIEVRVEPIRQDEKQKDDKDLIESINLVITASQNMQFMKLEGDPILHLPETPGKVKKGKDL
jgi:hypothetical protein